MKKIVVTGSQGFIGSYLCQELLDNNYMVIGIDDYSKYGFVNRDHDNHPNFKLYKFDIAEDVVQFSEIMDRYKPDYIFAGAAIIGGITLFHEKAHSLLKNLVIDYNTFQQAIKGYREGYLKRIIVMSSSMVYENTKTYPTPENDVMVSPPPSSTYGFSKLAIEYQAKGAWEEHKLPFSIVRAFNAVGLGEYDAKGDKEILSGNIKMMMSHVLPDIVNKCVKGQNPLHILGDGKQIRHLTHGTDLAKGIRLVIESDKAINESFNISTAKSTTMLELAEKVWKKVNPDKEFKYVSDKPYTYDVACRIPSVEKAKELLGFEAKIDLDFAINELVEYMTKKEYGLSTQINNI